MESSASSWKKHSTGWLLAGVAAGAALMVLPISLGVGNVLRHREDQEFARQSDEILLAIASSAFGMIVVAAFSMLHHRKVLADSRAAAASTTRYLATLAHDLRGPLVPLTNAIYMARHTSDRVVHEEMLETIERQVTRLLELIETRLETPHDAPGTAL